MNQEVKLPASVCLFWGQGVLLREVRAMCLRVSVFEGEYMGCQLSVVPVLECVREGEGQRTDSPPQGLLTSKLLARLVPGHLGSTRALWCAGEKWKC